MLTHLHIEHFVLIDDLDIDFNSGMNVILGETGSGKSILMDALSLLSGSKSEFEKIRIGEEKAFIEGVFRIENKDLLKELSLLYSDYIEDDTFILSRTLDIKNKSTSRLNGRIVPLSLMKEIMFKMLDIHSSSNDLFFFDEKKQLSILDSFIKGNSLFNDNDKLIYDKYIESYNNYSSILKEIDHYNSIINNGIDINYIEYQYNELENANIKENEIEELENEVASLTSIINLSSNMEKFSSLHEIGINKIYEAKKVLDNIKDDLFINDKEKYIDAYFSLIDAYDSMESSFKDILDKANRVEEIRNRLTYLHSLKRKYGSSTKEILKKKDDFKQILIDYENAEYELKKLNIKLEEANNLLRNDDIELLNLRKKYALYLEKAIDKELNDLLFNTASFKVEFYDDVIKNNGIHNIKFKLKANEGMEYLSLKDTASLGESSRLSLALKKVFFDYSYKETLIFDEVDIGISGKAALSVGNKIYELSKITQVMCISHLGQVAIKGDHFYYIKKVVENNTTKSNITKLSQDQAIIEISKMVSGGLSNKESINLVKSWK